MGLLLLRQLCYASGQKEKNEVVMCAVNPGFCKSEKVLKLKDWKGKFLYKWFATTTAEAVKNIVWASVEDEIPSGSYVHSCAVSK
jgi:retinol dehydrogenase-12